MVRPAAHSLAHRGPTATPSHSHTRVRWQPYYATLSSISARPSPSSYLITPASSVSSISPSPPSLYEPERPRNPQFHPRECQLRDPQRSKYVTGLVDQAVKSICEIWHPQDIPPVFLTSSRPAVASASSSTNSHLPSHPNPLLYGRNTQLPSPISPTTQPSPSPTPCMPHSHSPCSPEMRLTRVSGDQYPRSDVALMKGFVHEVLRRSRTSGSVLQTALCYLEAIRAKVPELIAQENEHPGSTSQKESVERIIQGGVDPGVGLDGPSSNALAGNDLLDTVRVNPISFEVDSSCLEPVFAADKVSLHKPKPGSASLAPLPPLPSPLLCPRRTFLASLILASKFMQDRCYSNRAWAKLSGLPPREIGRCERALGEALEWRLWVGKLPAAPTAPRRAISKCKSESNILCSSNLQTSSAMEIGPVTLSPPSMAGSPLASRSHTGLRRHATLPVHTFYPEDSYSTTIPASVESSIWMSAAGSSLGMDHSPSNSISPPTPGLSYSPTPTESSLGDRTVQMSSFMDISTPPLPCQFAAFTSVQNDKILSHAPIPFLYSIPNNAFQSHDVDPPFPSVGLSSSNNGPWPYAF